MQACQLLIIFFRHFTNSIHSLTLSHLLSKLVIFQLLLQKDTLVIYPVLRTVIF